MARWAPGFCAGTAGGLWKVPLVDPRRARRRGACRAVRPPARATSGSMSRPTFEGSHFNSERKCTAWHGSGRCSAQLSTPYPCRAALLQHRRPPLQGAAAAAHLVVLWSEQS